METLVAVIDADLYWDVAAKFEDIFPVSDWWKIIGKTSITLQQSVGGAIEEWMISE